MTIILMFNIYTYDTSFPNHTLIKMFISHSSKNLRLVFDDKFSFMNHISSITNASNVYLFKIKNHFPENLGKL